MGRDARLELIDKPQVRPGATIAVHAVRERNINTAAEHIASDARTTAVGHKREMPTRAANVG
jgi:hypothetical protein